MFRQSLSRILLIAVSLMGLPLPSEARWANIPLDVLVQTSDLVVIGYLRDATEESLGEVDYGQGIIDIDEVLWGKATVGESLTLTWRNGTDVICPRLNHINMQNKRSIWLLNVTVDGQVTANYPGRVVSPREREKVERMLVMNKVCLRKGDSFNISIVFRNASSESIEFPGMQYTNGVLSMNPAMRLDVDHDKGAATSPLPDRIIASQTVLPIVVGPGQEHVVTVDLRTLFKIDAAKVLFVKFSISSAPPANIVTIFPESER